MGGDDLVVESEQLAVLRYRPRARMAVAVLIDSIGFLVVDPAASDCLLSQPGRDRPRVLELLVRQHERWESDRRRRPLGRWCRRHRP